MGNDITSFGCAGCDPRQPCDLRPSDLIGVQCGAHTGEVLPQAEAKFAHYRAGADLGAIAFMTGQANLDTAGATAEKITEMQGAFNLNIGPITGSHATVAARLDEVAAIEGVKGVMCVFDDYPTATAEFGDKVMPLMQSRR